MRPKQEGAYPTSIECYKNENDRTPMFCLIDCYKAGEFENFEEFLWYRKDHPRAYGENASGLLKYIREEEE